VAFPDGRVFRVRQDAPSWPAQGPAGRPTVLGAGPRVSPAYANSTPGE
jgi:hypothetical protein